MLLSSFGFSQAHGEAVNGGWGEWAGWGACSATCGGARKFRFRKCDQPAPAHGGRNCFGSAESSTKCNQQNCPIDGGWSAWGGWSTCSMTCGGGHKNNFRRCTSPAPQHGGKPCPGDGRMTQQCNTQACPFRMPKNVMTIIRPRKTTTTPPTAREGCFDKGNRCVSRPDNVWCYGPMYRSQCRKTCGLC